MKYKIPQKFVLKESSEFDKYLNLLAEKIKSHDSIKIFGDYDVDGTSAAAILFLFLRQIGKSVEVLIGDRKDGYGLTDSVVSELQSSSASLIICVDCATSSVDQVAELSLTHDVLVIDHHVPSPAAVTFWRSEHENAAIINAHCSSHDATQYRYLSAAGVAYVVVSALIDRNKDVSDSFFVKRRALPAPEKVKIALLKIAGLAQVADVISFVDAEGAFTVAYEIASSYNTVADKKSIKGVDLLFNGAVTLSKVGFTVAPIINAAGRVGDANRAFNLMTNDSLTAELELEALRASRKNTQKDTSNLSDFEKDCLNKGGVRVLANDAAHVGVIGIAAARAAERFKAPAIYLAESDSSVKKGSMRAGPTDFNCESFIVGCLKLGVLKTGGGHFAAAGLSVDVSRLPEFLELASTQTFNYIEKEIEKVTEEELKTVARAIKRALPLGKGFEAPRFETKMTLITASPLVRKDDGKPWAYRCDSFNGGSVLVLADLTARHTSVFSSLLLAGKAVEVEGVWLVEDNSYRNHRGDTHQIQLKLESVVESAVIDADITAENAVTVSFIKSSQNAFFWQVTPSSAWSVDLAKALGDKSSKALRNVTHVGVAICARDLGLVGAKTSVTIAAPDRLKIEDFDYIVVNTKAEVMTSKHMIYKDLAKMSKETDLGKVLFSKPHLSLSSSSAMLTQSLSTDNLDALNIKCSVIAVDFGVFDELSAHKYFLPLRLFGVCPEVFGYKKVKTAFNHYQKRYGGVLFNSITSRDGRHYPNPFVAQNLDELKALIDYIAFCDLKKGDENV